MLSCEQVEKYKSLKMQELTELKELKEQESFLKKPHSDEKQIVAAEEDFDEDTRCGLGLLKGKLIQKLASKKTFLIVHSLTGMMYNGSFYYYSGTLTTLEKHYKFSSAQVSYIGAVYDVVATIVALIAPYYCSKGRFPRWMGFAIFCYGISNFMYILPYVFFGAGSDALSLTEEFGQTFNENSTKELIHQMKMKELCYANKTLDDCSADKATDNTPIVVLLFVLSSAIGGLGGAIYGTLGNVYIDDNVKKSKAPILICLSSFIRLLAPAVGYSIASYSLKFYITPSLHPKINDEDPRWIGAWWCGYVFFACVMIIMSPIIAMFPKVLPRGALRRKQELLKKMENQVNGACETVTKTSIQDLIKTFKRLLTNKVYFCNTMAGVFYCFGYVPFFFFQAKYIQIHFLFSPSDANMITGTVSLIFAALGMLTAGIIITIFKPPARYLAMWNIIASLFSVVGIIAYGYFSCTASSNSLIMENFEKFSSCNQNCKCDFVQYAPICGENNVTYVSSCHAGCTDEFTDKNGTKTFTNCICVNSPSENETSHFTGGSASQNACPLDCMPKFIIFFLFLCINKFIGGTEGTANFLLGVRCVDKADKAVSMGMTIAVLSFLAVVPSPIFFGWIIDQSCLFWGKTCTSTGNCWLYDTDRMRYTLNITAAGFVFIGTLWDIGTWYHSKDVEIFDKEEDEVEENDVVK